MDIERVEELRRRITNAVQVADEYAFKVVPDEIALSILEALSPELSRLEMLERLVAKQAFHNTEGDWCWCGPEKDYYGKRLG